MNLKYETRDGRTYEGDTAFQVVDAMRYDSPFTETKDNATYMHGAAARWSVTDRVLIRVDTEENFVHDLEAAGIVRRVS